MVDLSTAGLAREEDLSARFPSSNLDLFKLHAKVMNIDMRFVLNIFRARLQCATSGLLVAAMLVVANMHLPVLQVAAWTGMLLNFSKEVELAEAVEMTFNGENPCRMCTVIKQAQTQDDGPDESLQAETASRLLLFLETFFTLTPFSKGEALPAAHGQLARLRAEPPELPPPRAFS